MAAEQRCYVIFSALFAPSMGGVENYTQCLARELRRDGSRVIVVTSMLGDEPAREVNADGVEVVRLPATVLLKGRLPISRRNADYRRLWGYLSSVRADYVLVNTRFYRHSLEGLRYARDKGITPILIEHGSAHLTLGNAVFDRALALYEHAITGLVKRGRPLFYGVSEKSNRWLEHFGIRAEGVLKNAIDAPEFRALASARDFLTESGIGGDAFVVGYAGRLTPEKGIASLMETADLLQEEEGIHFLVAGSGSCESLASDAKRRNVTFLGRLDKADLSALLSQLDMFCLPSRSEGFATVLLESGAWGVPFAATDVGGVDELVEGRDSKLLLASASPGEIADAIKYARDNREEMRCVGRRLREHVENECTWLSTASSVRSACANAMVPSSS